MYENEAVGNTLKQKWTERLVSKSVCCYKIQNSHSSHISRPSYSGKINDYLGSLQV